MAEDKTNSPTPATQKASNPLAVEGVTASKKNLTLEEIRDKDYQGKALTVEQQTLLNQANSQENSDRNDGAVGKTNPNRDHQQGKKEPIFKEQDIIDYMFKEWFLAGADYLANTFVVCPLECCVGGFFDSFDKEIDYKENRNNDATSRFKDIVQHAVTADHKRINGIKDNYTEEDFASGKYPELAKKIQEKDPSRTFTPKELATMQNNMVGISKQAEALATNLAAARILRQKAKDTGSHGADPTADFAAMKEEAHAEVLKIFANRDRNIPENEFYTSMNNLASDALKEETKNINRGKYQERGKEPGTNKSLQTLEALIAPAQNRQPENLQEAISNQPPPIPPMTPEPELVIRSQELEARRRNLNNFREQHPNVAAPAPVQNIDFNSIRYSGNSR